MKTYKNLASVIRSVVTEAHTKDHPPFTPDEKSPFKKPAGAGDVAGRNRAQALARKAMQQKMKESFDLDISEEEADDLLNSIQEVSEAARRRPPSDIEVGAPQKPGESDYDHFRRTVEPPKRFGNRSIKEESEWMRTMHFTPDDHEREAAKHLKDADAHKKSGNMPEHYAAMINHWTSKAKAQEKRTGPPRGTGPA